jgi:hypothetical protein
MRNIASTLRKFRRTKLSQHYAALTSISTNVRVPELPLEIVELVIGYLKDDKRALVNCSLVCRAWLSQSQRLLFHSVELNPRTVTSFVELFRIDGSSPFFASSVGMIELQSLATWEPSSLKPLLRQECRFQLERIPSLRIASTLLTTVPLRTWERLGPVFWSSVKQLYLEGVVFESNVHLMRFLAAFQVLESVILRKITCFEETFPKGAMPQLPLTLKDISLLHSGKLSRRHTLLAMISQQKQLKIHRLVLDALCPTEFGSCMALFGAHGKFVSELHLSINITENDWLPPGPCISVETSLFITHVFLDYILSKIHLASLTQLASLHFTNVGLCDFTDDQTYPKSIPSLLSSINCSAGLQSLRLYFHIGPYENIHNFDWVALGTLLAKNQSFVHSLQDIAVEIRTDCCYAPQFDLQEEINRHFSMERNLHQSIRVELRNSIGQPYEPCTGCSQSTHFPPTGRTSEDARLEQILAELELEMAVEHHVLGLS